MMPLVFSCGFSGPWWAGINGRSGYGLFSGGTTATFTYEFQSNLVASSTALGSGEGDASVSAPNFAIIPNDTLATTWSFDFNTAAMTAGTSLPVTGDWYGALSGPSYGVFAAADFYTYTYSSNAVATGAASTVGNAGAISGALNGIFSTAASTATVNWVFSTQANAAATALGFNGQYGDAAISGNDYGVFVLYNGTTSDTYAYSTGTVAAGTAVVANEWYGAASCFDYGVSCSNTAAASMTWNFSTQAVGVGTAPPVVTRGGASGPNQPWL